MNTPTRLGSLFRCLVPALGALTLAFPLAARQEPEPQSDAPARNSTKKLRPEPSAFAQRAGSAVQWRPDLDAALEESAQSGKSVFWYVPSTERSFVDREVELDRKLLAGPFSWPSLIHVLNSHYVPVRLAADKELCERFGLSRDEFFAPGFLVLQDGHVDGRYDGLTTHHPSWYLAQLLSRLGGDPFEFETPRITRAAEPDAAEALFLGGANAEAGVRALLWQRLIEEHPDHPLAWKAAMELEGHGPFLRGQETYEPLPLGALMHRGGGTRVAYPLYSEEQLWELGARFLSRQQQPDGSFTDSIYDFGGTDSMPNVHAAVSALVALALIGADEDVAQGRLGRTRARALEYAVSVALAPNADLDERVWAQVYGLRAVVADGRRIQAGAQTPEMPAQVLASTPQELVDRLVADQLESGAWRHEYANPFVTADALLALWEAKQAGLTIPNETDVVARAIASLVACRSEEGGYSYGQTRPGRTSRGTLAASVGRAPRAELAFLRWAPEECRGLEKVIASSFEHEGPLLAVQKLDDHGPLHAYGGFFFWYDLQARTEAIAALPAGSVRDAFVQRQREQILGLPEIDGCFVDSHELGRAYGTSMALWCLALLGRLDD